VLAETTANDSVRLGAINARVDTLERILNLKRLYGLARWDLQQIRPEADVLDIARRLVTVLNRHQISEELAREIYETFKHDAHRTTWLGAAVDEPRRILTAVPRDRR
jgi:hypothetical protein